MVIFHKDDKFMVDSNGLPTSPNIGYHLENIPKAKFGTFEKIVEEFLELKDAHAQKVVVMELVELSDLLGAIDGYVSKYNLTLSDLIAMKDVTKRVFENGHR